jgi:hypothetical protein
VRFPSLTINHGMLLFKAADAGGRVEFAAYDPNDPERPATISFDRAARQFYLPANAYWAGGPLNVIQIFTSWFL